MNEPSDTWPPGKLLQSDSQRDVRDYLARTEDIDPAELVELICADQLQRWQQGERVPIEAYLGLHPMLTGDSAVAFELIYAEFLLREHLGETPSVSEYQWRFPEFTERLTRQVDLHHALEMDDQGDESESAPEIDTHCFPPPSAVPAVAKGLVVPGYEVLEELGRGGMGVVYKARDTKLNRLVALKVLRDGALADGDEDRRFHREAELVARMAHPNIVPIYEVGIHEGRSYLALEYVEGGSLKRKLTGTPQDPYLAAELVQTLARAVHHAHQRGVVHRDLNPSNVLLSGVKGQESDTSSLTPDSCLLTPVPKITDFGLAKQLAGDPGQTRSGTVLGTPCYMSPEQAQGKGNEAGPATDIYALGTILYEMLTGRPPFQCPNVFDTLIQVAIADPVRPRALQPSVPRDLETVCLKCLHKQPDRRYPTALALAEDLQRWLAGEPIVARPVGELERAWLWARRKPGLATAMVVALFALVIGSAASTWFGMDARQQARESRRHEGDAITARDQANQAADKASEEQKTAEGARDQARKSEAKAKQQAAEQTFELGLQQAQVGAVDRGLFLMLDAWKQAPEDAEEFRRVVRTNLTGWAQQLPRLRQALRLEPTKGSWYTQIAPADPDGRTFFAWLYGGPIHCWDSVTGQAAGSPLAVDTGERILDTSLDGRRLFLYSRKANFIADRVTGQPMGANSESWRKRKLFDFQNWLVAQFDHLPDIVVTGNEAEDGSRRFWDLRTDKQLPARLQLQSDDSFRLMRTVDGREVVVVFSNVEAAPRVLVLELATGKQHVLTKAALRDDPGLSLVGVANPSMSYDGRVALILSGDRLGYQSKSGGERPVTWWDLSTGRPQGASWRPRLHSRHDRLRHDSLEMLSEGIDDRFRLYDLGSGLQRGGDLPAIVWRGSSGKTIGTGDGSQSLAASNFSGSADGRLVYTLDSAGIARVWDTGLGRLQSTANANPHVSGRVFRGWNNDIKAVYSPDRRRVLLTNRRLPYATLLDARTGAILGAPRQPYLDHAVFSPDGRYLATASSGIQKGSLSPNVVLHDGSTGKFLFKEDFSPALYALAFSPDGKTLAAGGVGGAWLLDVPGKAPRPNLLEATCVCDLKFDATGRRLIALATEGWEGVGAGLRVWDVATGKRLGPFRADPNNGSLSSPVASWRADTGELASFAPGTSQLNLMSADAREVRGGPWSTGPVRLPTFSDDGKRLAASTAGNSVQQWDTATGQSVGRAMRQSGPVRLIRYSPDRKVLAVVGIDGSIRVWDATTGWPLGPPLLHHNLPLDVTFADEGHTLLSITLAGTVRAWPMPRPVEDGSERFETWMQARGGVRWESDEAVPLTPEQWQAACRTLATRWPARDLALNEPADLPAWHRQRALDAEESGNDRGELYHLTRLAVLCPQEAGLHARIERVHVRVGARLPAGPARQREWQLAWAARKRGMGRPGEVEPDRLAALEATYLQRWDEALWYLDRLVGHRDGGWQSWADRGDIYGRLGDKARRDADFRQALARGGGLYGPFIVTVADAWARDDRWREVASLLLKDLKRWTMEQAPLRQLGLAHLKAGDHLVHAVLCESLLRSIPRNRTIYLSNTVAESCAMSPTAMKDWSRPLAIIQANVRFLEAEEKKAGNEAEKRHLRSLRRPSLRTHGALLYRTGRHAKAISVLTEAMKLSPDGQGEPLDWAWMGLAHAAAGKPDRKEALHWLNRARLAPMQRDGAGLWDAVLVEVLVKEAESGTRQ
jgi:WD40 repeat protein/tRNA A-37 threonylcarbamoyl transferase component Bud32/tetratricopeptide (TPR) repeat protein